MKSTQLMRMNRTRAALSGAALIAIFVSCRASSMESEVSGNVTLDGSKIGPGTIVFAPSGHSGKPSTGSIESDGSYQLKTSRESGLAAGAYRVAISIRKMPENVKRGERPPLGKLLIPEKYEDETKSGLQYEVSPGRNTINIELVSR
jgi:hypothetical protein